MNTAGLSGSGTGGSGLMNNRTPRTEQANKSFFNKEMFGPYTSWIIIGFIVTVVILSVWVLWGSNKGKRLSPFRRTMNSSKRYFPQTNDTSDYSKLSSRYNNNTKNINNSSSSNNNNDAYSKVNASGSRYNNTVNQNSIWGGNSGNNYDRDKSTNTLWSEQQHTTPQMENSSSFKQPTNISSQQSTTNSSSYATSLWPGGPTGAVAHQQYADTYKLYPSSSYNDTRNDFMDNDSSSRAQLTEITDDVSKNNKPTKRKNVLDNVEKGISTLIDQMKPQASKNGGSLSAKNPSNVGKVGSKSEKVSTSFKGNKTPEHMAELYNELSASGESYIRDRLGETAEAIGLGK